MPRTKKSKSTPGARRSAPLTRVSRDKAHRARNKRQHAKNAKLAKKRRKQDRQQKAVQVQGEPNVSIELGLNHDDGGHSNIVDEEFNRRTYQDQKNAAVDAWERDKFHFKDLYQKSISQGLPRGETVNFAHKTQIVRSCRCRPLIETLMEHHFIPASYRYPKSAVHFGALEMFSQMQKIAGTTAAAWAKSLNERNGKGINKGPRLGTSVLNKTYLDYARIKLLVEEEMQAKTDMGISPAVLPAP